MSEPTKVMVVGGGTPLGDSIAAALLREGAQVGLLTDPDARTSLGPLADRVRVIEGDVWNPGSLKGRARGYRTVVHTVGGLREDPARGRTYAMLNLVSARHVAAMALGDGAGHIVLLSAARAPWVAGGYIAAKRQAEAFLARTGLRVTVVRAPLAYQRGAARPPLARLLSVLAAVTPFFRRSAPMPLDVLARGVARLALDPPARGVRVAYAGQLKRLNTAAERQGRPSVPPPPPPDEDTKPHRPPAGPPSSGARGVR